VSFLPDQFQLRIDFQATFHDLVSVRQRKMYVDIDGVLAVWDPACQCVELARGFGQLMRFCQVHSIQPFWLSMWSGNPAALEGLTCLLWPTTCPTMAHPQIVPIGKEGKATAIDFDSDFVWIEDGLTPRDAEVLRRHNAFDRFFFTNGLDPNCLLKFMDFTRARLGLPDLDLGVGPAWDSPMARPRVRPPEAG
jgi:hypothetical protein